MRRVRVPRDSKLAWRARAWLLSDEQQWPLAFLPICDVLGLDASRIRARAFGATPALPPGRPWLHAVSR